MVFTLCGRKGDSLSRLYQVPGYQNVLNRVLESDSKGTEGREMPLGKLVSSPGLLSLCVISEEMIKSGSLSQWVF